MARSGIVFAEPPLRSLSKLPVTFEDFYEDGPASSTERENTMADMTRHNQSDVTRWNPLSEMVTLREAMNNLFEDSFISSRSLNARGTPMNLYETDKGFTLQIPMPGVKPQDVDITVQKDSINLKWETKVAHPENATIHWSGFQSGQYQQSFTLPASINPEGVEAHHADGVLTLDLPKAAHAQARTVKVNPV